MGSYTADALVAPSTTEGKEDRRQAESWLAELAGSAMTAHATVGVGTVVEVSSAASFGTALVVDEAVVHLAAFNQEEDQAGRLMGRRPWAHGG
ncbi:MAG: hypothetical protein M3N51_11390 [Actinomycetota bacterium]|nr:hypothetical protein [Actinomycetota bacterium]